MCVCVILFGCFHFLLCVFLFHCHHSGFYIEINLHMAYTMCCVSNDWLPLEKHTDTHTGRFYSNFCTFKWTSSTKSMMCLYVFCIYKLTLLGKSTCLKCVGVISKNEKERAKKNLLVIFTFTFISIFATLAWVNEVWVWNGRVKERKKKINARLDLCLECSI